MRVNAAEGRKQNGERRADLAEFGARLLLLHAAVRHQVVEELCAGTVNAKLKSKMLPRKPRIRAHPQCAPIPRLSLTDGATRGLAHSQSHSRSEAHSGCAHGLVGENSTSSVRVPPPLAYSMTR